MISPTDAIISSPSQISSLPGELLGTSSGPLSASQAKQDQLSTISSPQPKHCDTLLQCGPGRVRDPPLMSPLLSPQDSLPLSPSLGRDQLGPLSPSSPLQLPPPSPLPSHNESWDEDKSGRLKLIDEQHVREHSLLQMVWRARVILVRMGPPGLQTLITPNKVGE